MSWRDALKTAASPLAARERPPSASHVGTRHHGHHRDDDLIPRGDADASTSLAPPHELDLRNARANAFAPTQPTALELCVNVYNLHPAFTTRAPLLVCALLVEVPPPTLPYKMPAAWKRAPERHRAWRVAGSTEPSRAACNAHCVRFAVPVVIDKLIGGQRSLENKKAVVAVYRIPEDDEADDTHLAADENLPTTTRPKLTPERLDEFEYLGEAKLRCHELVRAVFDAQRDAAEDFAKQSKDNQKSTLDVANDPDFPKRGELKTVKRKSPVRDDGAVRAPVGNARAQYALVKSGQRDPVSNPPIPGEFFSLIFAWANRVTSFFLQVQTRSGPKTPTTTRSTAPRSKYSPRHPYTGHGRRPMTPGGTWRTSPCSSSPSRTRAPATWSSCFYE